MGLVAFVSSHATLVLAEGTERKDGAGTLPLFAVRQTWQAQYTTTGGTPDVPR